MTTVKDACRGRIPGWVSPTPDELRQMARDAGMSWAAACRSAGIDARHGRKYTAHTNPVPIPLGVYIALLCGLGRHGEAMGVASGWARVVARAIDAHEGGGALR